jgi:fructose-bisphosphate aldolase class I
MVLCWFQDSGVIPGIKVDMGLQPLPGGHPVETWCTGLDGLVDRAKKYYAQGARFAKWRAVLQVRSHFRLNICRRRPMRL